jgi:hypothetical protein
MMPLQLRIDVRVRVRGPHAEQLDLHLAGDLLVAIALVFRIGDARRVHRRRTGRTGPGGLADEEHREA